MAQFIAALQVGLELIGSVRQGNVVPPKGMIQHGVQPSGWPDPVGEPTQMVEPFGIVDMQHPSNRGAEPGIVPSWRCGVEAGGPTQSGPATAGLATVQILKLQSGFHEELRERDVAEPAKFGDEIGAAQPQRGAHVAQHDLLGDAVQVDVAARRQGGEILLNVAGQSPPAGSGQGAEA